MGVKALKQIEELILKGSTDIDGYTLVGGKIFLKIKYVDGKVLIDTKIPVRGGMADWVFPYVDKIYVSPNKTDIQIVRGLPKTFNVDMSKLISVFRDKLSLGGVDIMAGPTDIEIYEDNGVMIKFLNKVKVVLHQFGNIKIKKMTEYLEFVRIKPDYIEVGTSLRSVELDRKDCELVLV